MENASLFLSVAAVEPLHIGITRREVYYMKTIYAGVENYVDFIKNNLDKFVESVYLFGSSSYGDFITGYSDIDLCILVKPIPISSYVETAIVLKTRLNLIPIINVDLTIIEKDEIEKKIENTVNPMLYEQILQGKHLLGNKLPIIYSKKDVWKDSIYVMGTCLRLLRSSINSAHKMRPLRAFRFFDEILYSFSKALYYYTELELVSSRKDVFMRIQNYYQDIDTNIYDEILKVREKIKKNGKFPNIDVSQIFLTSLFTAESLWRKVSDKKISCKPEFGEFQSKSKSKINEIRL